MFNKLADPDTRPPKEVKMKDRGLLFWNEFDAAIAGLGKLDFKVDSLEFKYDLPDGRPTFAAEIILSNDLGLDQFIKVAE